MRVVNLGVDFGSTGLRVAYAAPDQPVRTLTLPGPPGSWLRCEPVRASRLGFAFPSLKSRLGAGGTADGFEALVEAFRAARTAVERAAGGSVGRTVVCVPVRYPSDQRTAVRDAANRAGLADVQLIGDSAAAVIGQAPPAGGSATVLVYGLGYEGFEIGLVRVAGGHYRVLGYDGGVGPGGATLDYQILVGWVETLRLHGLLPPVPRQDAGFWLPLREAAQRVKEELETHPQAVFPVAVKNRGGTRELDVVFERAEFEVAVARMIAGTLDRAAELLKQSQLGPADLDSVLLFGGSVQLPGVAALFAGRFGVTPVLAPPDQLARGAARHADGLRSGDPAPGGPEDRSTDIERPVGRDEVPELATIVVASPDTRPPGARLVLSADDLAVPAAEPDGGGAIGLDEARRLIAAGRREEAIALLREMLGEVRDLLDQLTAPAPAPTAEARRSLVLARALLEQGRFDEAVQAAHVAWSLVPDSPDLFEEMIDIHCRAATAEAGTERFPDELRWLRCAYGHDRSNARVRDLLAERTYRYARHLSRLGRLDEALHAVGEALTWDPERRDALDLQRGLLRRRSRPPVGDPEDSA
ncbi:MAG: hypothetical protein E6G35_03630 [Actinobacteria bacterium]|nr:MAG: hypothetical protein E6G35_03630 [Actinomycetota bacterium]